MKRFTKWLVRHRGLVIIICLLLMIPSVLGMAATKTKYDLLYYLPQDLDRRIWKQSRGRKFCWKTLAREPSPCW